LALALSARERYVPRVGPLSAGRVFALGALMALALSTQASAATLYDQFNNAAPSDATDSYYYPPPGENVQLADDFTIPTGQTWQLTSAQAPGPVGTYPFRLTVFADAGGSPGGQRFQVQATNSGDTFPISGVSQLQAGHYWISIQLMNLAIWQWKDRTVQSGSPAMLQNPDAMEFATCTTWKPRTQCPPADSSNPDQVFALSGDVVPPVSSPKKKCKRHKKHKRAAGAAKKKCKKKKK
jgi:hypothetical protein